MADFVLRPTRQKKILRGLLFAAPIFLFQPLMQIVQGAFIPDLPTLPYIFQFWIIGAPYLYLACLVASYFERIKVKDGVLAFGLLGLNKVSIYEIEEVSGDEGDISNDFKESILIKFRDADRDRGLVLPVHDYDEHELRAFLSMLRENNPACSYTYSDVIPFESRGLIRFLLNVNDSSTMTIKLSKSPMEDAIVALVKGHERTFWIVYLLFWCLILCSLSYYLYSMGAQWAQTVQGTGPLMANSARTRELASLLSLAESNPTTGFVDLQLLRISFFFQLSTDYLANGSLTTVLTGLWVMCGVVIPLGLNIMRLLSPTYLFIDQKTIGMGSVFLRWDDITSVSLRKLGPMGDPLEGELVINALTGRISIELTKVPDVDRRQRILRMVDRYATTASFDGEFMRTSNALFDIQFTDLWLEEQGSSPPKDLKSDLKSLLDGKYLVDSLLGYGGQGVTYLASQTTDGSESKQVVIKELVLPNFADVRIMQDAMSRFERGARLLKGLDDPQVVKLLDHFFENGKAYLVMEYVKGQTMRDFIEKNGALDLEEVKKTGIRLCEILMYLHERDVPVIHCDFAPDNLIVTADGDIKLIDFDVARVVDSKAHTFIAGRPSYTPPEQFRGQPTRQSDIFALGAILHFLAQGSDPPPLCAGTASDDTLWHDTALEKLIMDCCQFEESDRPDSAKTVRERLSAININEQNDEEAGQRISVASTVMEPG